MSDHASARAFFCTLPPAALRQRRSEVLAAIRRRVEKIEETEAGFVFTFPRSEALRAELEDFVRFEAACCAFIDMRLTETDASIALVMQGGSGAKPFIQAELIDVPACGCASGSHAGSGGTAVGLPCASSATSTKRPRVPR